MTLTFYPHEDDLQNSSIEQKLEILMEAAERYKAVILETKTGEIITDQKKNTTPRELRHAFNWEELALLLREFRELPENNQPHRLTKADRLTKLAEVYEVLRGAKMPKLEAIRLALVNEANQLRTSTTV